MSIGALEGGRQTYEEYFDGHGDALGAILRVAAAFRPFVAWAEASVGHHADPEGSEGLHAEGRLPASAAYALLAFRDFLDDQVHYIRKATKGGAS